MTFHSGKGGKAVIGAAELAITGWSVEPSAAIAEFRNSKTGNFPKRERTFYDLTGSITMDFDFDDNPFALSPTAVQVGAILTNVKLYLNGTTGLYWDLPSIIVTTTPQSLEVAGGITTTFNFATDGTYTPPGGTALATS